MHRHCQSPIYFIVFRVVLSLIRGGKINLRDSLDQVGGMNDGPQNTKEFYPVNCMSRLTESRSVPSENELKDIHTCTNMNVAVLRSKLMTGRDGHLSLLVEELIPGKGCVPHRGEEAI